MYINFNPVRLDKELKIIKEGDKLIINEEEFDFTNLENDQIIPNDAIDSEWIVGDVKKENNNIFITIRLPHGPATEKNYNRRFPKPIEVIKDGEIELP